MTFSFGGAGASSTPSFSFSQSSASLFGAASSSLQKTSSSPLFGSTQSTFGAASSPGLFGASSTPSPAFSFTSQPAQSQPSLFGAAPTPAATPGFGFGGASAPQATPSLFGQPQQQQPAGQLATMGQPTGFGGVPPSAPQVPDLSAIYELKSLKDAFVPAPGNQRYRFQYLFLNKVDNPASRVKPTDIDELQWREAMQRAGGPDNADQLWPVLAQGFKDLLARKAAQDNAIEEGNARLESLRQRHNTVVLRQETVLRQQLEAIRQRQVTLYQKLLRVVRYVDALEGRFAQAMGYRSTTPRELMQRLQDELAALEAEIAPAAAGSLQTKVDSLRAASRSRAGAPMGASVQSIEKYVDKGSMDRAFAIVSGYAEALTKMQDVLKRDARDAAILEDRILGNDMVP